MEAGFHFSPKHLMNESLQNIGNIIAEPSAAFSSLKSKPRAFIAYIVLYLLFVFIAWATMPYSDVLTSAQFNASDMTPEQREAAENMGRIFKSLGIFIGPLFVLLFFVIISGLLRLVVRFVMKNDTLKFKHIYAGVVHVSLIGCLIEMMNTTLLLVLKDVENIKHAVDLRMIPGLHHIVGPLLGGEGNPKLLMFLSYFNPLNVWVIAVMAIAIAVLGDVDRNRARLAAIILWLLSLLPAALAAT